MKRYIFLFIIFFLGKTLSAQTRIGIDCGQPIDNTFGQISQNTSVTLLSSTCTPWVRVNFILGPWGSPDDTTKHSGRTWFQAYDEIIDSLTNAGIQVYGLVGAQLVSQWIGDKMIAFPGADSAGAAAWKDEYVANFVQVVDHFKDRVRVFESYNEPNNWDNGWTSVVHPEWFALLLQEIYLNVKFFNGHWGDPAWQVTLVSGAVLTLDVTTGGQYINDTYWYGKNVFAWDWTSSQTGSYPLDGIGMHIYVEQGSSNPTTVTNAMNMNTNDFWNNVIAYEGAATTKQLWISEFGWESATYGEQFQADNLATSFSVLRNDARIAMALWFTLSDWPGGDWGIYYLGAFLPSERKLAYYAFLTETNCSPTGVSDIEEKIVSVFPNPANDLVNVPINEEGSEIKIRDVAGKIVLNAFTKDGRIEIACLKNGLYMLEATTGGKHFYTKVVKQ